jgi:hypothetical protein
VPTAFVAFPFLFFLKSAFKTSAGSLVSNRPYSAVTNDKKKFTRRVASALDIGGIC